MKYVRSLFVRSENKDRTEEDLQGITKESIFFILKKEGERQYESDRLQVCRPQCNAYILTVVHEWPRRNAIPFSWDTNITNGWRAVQMHIDSFLLNDILNKINLSALLKSLIHLYQELPRAKNVIIYLSKHDTELNYFSYAWFRLRCNAG